jgi:type IV pilus assembly protein PilM
MRVLMVAAKQDIILSYIDFLGEAGLQPVVFDVDLFALMNIFHLNYDLEKYQSSILLNIGTESTVAAFPRTVSIIRRGISRSPVRNSGKNSSICPTSPDMMHDILRGDVDEALDAKMISNALKQSGQAVCQCRRRGSLLFQTFDNVEKIDFIVIAGGYAMVPGLVNLIELRTAPVASVLDPFKNITYDQEALAGHDPRLLGTTLSVAMGLASRTY